MGKITLFAKASSRDEPYAVKFTLSDGTLSVWCNCPAGDRGQLCKHKRALVNNEPAMLYDENAQLNDLRQVNKWVQSTELPQIIQEIKTIEKDIEKAKRFLKSMKGKAERLMRNGV